MTLCCSANFELLILVFNSGPKISKLFIYATVVYEFWNIQMVEVDYETNLRIVLAMLTHHSRHEQRFLTFTSIIRQHATWPEYPRINNLSSFCLFVARWWVPFFDKYALFQIQADISLAPEIKAFNKTNQLLSFILVQIPSCKIFCG